MQWRGVVFCSVLFIVGYFWNTILDNVDIFHSHGYWLWSHEYEYYSRSAYNERKWKNMTGYNMSTCVYGHYGVDFKSKKDKFKLKKSNMTIHIYRNPSHTLLQLEWLWHHILVTKNEVKRTMNEKYLPEYGLRLVRVEGVDGLKRSSREITNLFVITESMAMVENDMFNAGLFFNTTKVGALIVPGENCNSGGLKDYLLNGDLRTAFMVFGDCMVVDDKKVKLWPLGPDLNMLTALDSGDFPLYTYRTQNIQDRKYDLTMLGTLRDVKITRLQAMLAFEQLCSGKKLNCYRRTQGYSPYSILGSMDSLLKTNGKLTKKFFRYWTDNPTMLNSKMILSPAGSTAEPGRVMETIMLGAVPIVEEWEEEGMSPLHGNTFRCLKGDNLAYFRDTKAPVFWVRDWGVDMKGILGGVYGNEILEEMQEQGRKWYLSLVEDLREKWVEGFN